MPKLPPFALAPEPAKPQKAHWHYHVVIFLLAAATLISIHSQLLTLPFFWDELGQFVPTALDLLRTGSWIAHSAVPNVHPPGLEVYLVIWYKLFGYSIPTTRIAMLVLAGAGLLLTFLLAIELSRHAEGAPAFLPPLFLLISPLFYMQSMMAQLDIPAMVFTLLVLLLFLKKRYPLAAAACLVLVLTKETGIVVPAILGTALLLRKEWKLASYFAGSAVALGVWLVFLRHGTGYWLGDPGFAHYNLEYSLHPVRAIFSIVRRIYYLFFAEFRWIGTLVLLFTGRRCAAFRKYEWRIVCAVSLATLILVSLLGGAELERYLLPVLPIFYIGVTWGITMLTRRVGVAVALALTAGLIVNLFWNPPYPFPYENNYSMVDCVKLQQAAASYADHELRGRIIATAWPFTAALRQPEYGYVQHKLKVKETGDFHVASIDELDRDSYDALITYTRTWNPDIGVNSLSLARRFLSRFYQWAPDITPEECERRGLWQTASWTRRGQAISIYVRQPPRF